MFDNAKSVIINNKEVKTIKNKKGGILYEKEYPLILSLTSDKDILSYYDNDVATLTASLTKGGVPVEGERVIFSSEDAVETTVVDTSGTYDLGDWFNIDCTNLMDGGTDSTKVLIIGDSSEDHIRIYRENGEITVLINYTGRAGLVDSLVIENGVLKGYQPAYDKYPEWDVSSVDLSIWNLYQVSSVSVTSYFYETGVTDSQGQCSVGYVGKGTGDLNIKCECMNLQETYVLYDTIWFDSNSANWTASNASTSYSNNTREMILNSNTALLNPTVNNNPFFISCNDDFIVEFYYGGGNASLYFAVSGQLYNMGISLNQARYNNKTIKLLVKPSEDKTEVYIDGVYFKTETNYRTFSGSNNCGLFFRTNNVSGVTVTFGNLKIYRA